MRPSQSGGIRACNFLRDPVRQCCLPLAPGKPLLPSLPLPVPYAIAEKAIEVGKLRIATHEVPRRSQSASPGHFPVHGSRRGSFRSNPTHPSAYVAPVLVLSAESDAAIRALVEYHRAPLLC